MIKNLTKPLVSIDTETTGVDPAKDRIITLAVVVYYPDGTKKRNEWMFHPGIPIPAGASDVHGIYDKDVEGKPQFSIGSALDIIEFMGLDFVMVGFNLLRFDIPIMIEHFHRAGHKGVWPKEGQLVIDAGNIFKKKEERTLTAAVKKFVGRDHSGAHGAMADAEATAEVLFGQLKEYADLAEMEAEALAKFSTMDGMVDFAGKLGTNAAGDIVYNIGKAKGVAVKNDPGFGYWMLERDFPEDTKRHLRRLLKVQENLL